MINAYIITEEGRRYNDAGLKYVKEMLEESFHTDPSEEITYCQGQIYNDREHLLSELERDEENGISSFLVISMADGTDFLPAGKEAKEFIRESTGTTWEAFIELIESHRNGDEQA